MQTVTLPSSNPNVLDSAQKIIAAGGLIAFPTDTVYGLSSTPFQETAIEKIFLAKGRDFNKAIAILIADLTQIPLVASLFTPKAEALANRFWPGALTLVVPIKPGLPSNLSPYPSIGLRMPDHPFALTLLKSLGPLATTSANLSGKQDARTAEEVLTQLDGSVDLLLDGGACPGGIPSTVVDCSQQEIHILREGAIHSDTIFDALGR